MELQQKQQLQGTLDNHHHINNFRRANAPGRSQRRGWNRGPLQDLFPRMPAASLEAVLDVCIAKDLTYDLSVGRAGNARRFSSLVVAHVRHRHTDYDRLLRDGDGYGSGGGSGGRGMERFTARQRTAAEAWKVLRAWCPWDEANPALVRCFQATLVRPEEREPGWDPMDIDDESYYHTTTTVAAEEYAGEEVRFLDDPMEIDG